MFTVSRDSLLYKTYNMLAKIMVFSIFTPTNWKQDTEAFRDICTFLRTTLCYLFIAIPMWIMILYGIFNIAYDTVVTFATMSMQNTSYIIVGLGTLAGIFAILGLILFILFVLVEKVWDKAGDSSSLWSLTVQAIKDKHNSVCQQIKVVDKK